jgi:23S rRNA pseudouridine2605 synthase
MRLNRFLASAGLGSRRGCETLILEGRVAVNGAVCTDLATQVGDADFVKIGGKRIQTERTFSALLNKPAGYLCTASDTDDRRTIFDLLPKNWPRVFHVGRLDMESEGLLIVTNDGDLSLKLTHPRYKIDKEYEVVLDRAFDMEQAGKLLKGVYIEGGWARAEKVIRLKPKVIKLVLRQGLKRQIRLMFYSLDYEVKQLRRTRIGPLKLEGMRPGEWRMLTATEIATLKNPKPEAPTKERKPTEVRRGATRR